MTDTIYALSSGGLPSGVAIIRLSGPSVRFVLETLIGQSPTQSLAPRIAQYCIVRDHDKQLIDKGISLFFPAPHSFTGEDVGELQLHGSVAVVNRLMDVLSHFEDLRLAEAGEFSRRAFANGKMDLTAAEGLADLIASETEAQRLLAQRNADGAQLALYSAWNKELLQCRAYLEAEIDFTDEEGVPGSVADQVNDRLQTLAAEMTSFLERHKAADIVRDGFRIVIVGAPNVGKSTLLNALLRRDAAIVSPIAGTTRDLVEHHLVIGGHRVLITDTAGLHESDDIIEMAGMERAREAFKAAHLILHLSDHDFSGLDLPALSDTQSLWLVKSKSTEDDPRADISISTVEGYGLTLLLDKITDEIEANIQWIKQVVPTRKRHIDALNQSLYYMELGLSDPSLEIEMRVENLRLASTAIEELVGVIGVEDILGSIFSEFCVGK